MTNAFAYARVSTGEQAKGFSLDAQFKEIEEYCLKHNITLLNRFSDSMSGTKLTERPGLMALVDKVNELKPEAIIATETDRISRNALQFGWISTHLSMKCGTKLIFVNESQTNDPAGRAFQKIRIVFSEFENDLRQWRIKRGVELARQHHRFMNRPPFGYCVKNKVIVADPGKINTVIDMFKDFSDGKAVRQLARKYHKAPSNIRYILNNRFYTDPYLNGKHKVFVSAENFQKAQERLVINRTHSHSQVITHRNL